MINKSPSGVPMNDNCIKQVTRWTSNPLCKGWPRTILIAAILGLASCANMTPPNPTPVAALIVEYRSLTSPGARTVFDLENNVVTEYYVERAALMLRRCSQDGVLCINSNFGPYFAVPEQCEYDIHDTWGDPSISDLHYSVDAIGSYPNAGGWDTSYYISYQFDDRPEHAFSPGMFVYIPSRGVVMYSVGGRIGTLYSVAHPLTYRSQAVFPDSIYSTSGEGLLAQSQCD